MRIDEKMILSLALYIARKSDPSIKTFRAAYPKLKEMIEELDEESPAYVSDIIPPFIVIPTLVEDLIIYRAVDIREGTAGGHTDLRSAISEMARADRGYLYLEKALETNHDHHDHHHHHDDHHEPVVKKKEILEISESLGSKYDHLVGLLSGSLKTKGDKEEAVNTLFDIIKSNRYSDWTNLSLNRYVMCYNFTAYAEIDSNVELMPHLTLVLVKPEDAAGVSYREKPIEYYVSFGKEVIRSEGTKISIDELIGDRCSKLIAVYDLSTNKFLPPKTVKSLCEIIK